MSYHLTLQTSSTERIFRNIELLHNIFDALGDPRAQPGDGSGSALVNCALVCRLWSLCALPIIWNKCRGASLGLFGILDKLHGSGDVRPAHYSHTSKGPIIQNWRRFSSCMGLMRSVELSLKGEGKGGMALVSPTAKALRSDVVRLTTSVAEAFGEPMFPNVRDWSVSMCEGLASDTLISCLHGQVRSFSLKWHPAQDKKSTTLISTASLLFIRLKSKCPLIERMVLDVLPNAPPPYHGIESTEARIASMLSSLRRLQSLTISPHLLRERVWLTLRKLKHPSSLLVPDLFTPYPTTSLIPNFLQGGGHLSTISLVVDYEALTTALCAQGHTPAPALTRLTLVARDVLPTQKANRLRKFLRSLARSAPNVESLSLALWGKEGKVKGTTTGRGYKLNVPQAMFFQELNALGRLTRLDILLVGVGKDDWADEQYGVLAKACPRLVELRVKLAVGDEGPMLDPKMVLSTAGHPPVRPPKATLYALSQIAQHCPLLERLSIQIDCRAERTPSYALVGRPPPMSIPAPLHTIPPLASWHPFSPCFQTLDVGMSPIDPAGNFLIQDVLRHLFRSIPTVPRILSGRPHPSKGAHFGTFDSEIEDDVEREAGETTSEQDHHRAYYDRSNPYVVQWGMTRRMLLLRRRASESRSRVGAGDYAAASAPAPAPLPPAPAPIARYSTQSVGAAQARDDPYAGTQTVSNWNAYGQAGTSTSGSYHRADANGNSGYYVPPPVQGFDQLSQPLTWPDNALPGARMYHPQEPAVYYREGEYGEHYLYEEEEEDERGSSLEDEEEDENEEEEYGYDSEEPGSFAGDYDQPPPDEDDEDDVDEDVLGEGDEGGWENNEGQGNPWMVSEDGAVKQEVELPYVHEAVHVKQEDHYEWSSAPVPGTSPHPYHYSSRDPVPVTSSSNTPRRISTRIRDAHSRQAKREDLQ